MILVRQNPIEEKMPAWGLKLLEVISGHLFMLNLQIFLFLIPSVVGDS